MIEWCRDIIPLSEQLGLDTTFSEQTLFVPYCQVSLVEIEIFNTEQLALHDICDAMLAILAQQVVLKSRTDDSGIWL